MVNADAPFRCVCINQLIRIFYLNINIRKFHLVRVRLHLQSYLDILSGYQYPDILHSEGVSALISLFEYFI